MTTIIPRFRCVGGEILLGDTPIDLAMAEEMQAIFQDELRVHYAANKGHEACMAHLSIIDLGTAMEAARQWAARQDRRG